MQPRAPRFGFVSLLVALSALQLAAPARAAAAEPPAAGPSPAVKAEARERFDTGLHLFEKGENASALAEFKRAYQLIPNPVVIYNMGLVYAAMNRPVDAVDALDQFLGDPGIGTVGAPQKKHAEEVRAEQEKRIAQLVVLTEQPATVEVDGVEVGRTPLAKPIRVGSGSHVVAVEAPGFLGSRREVTLAGQITETIAMAMQPTDTRMAQLVVTTAVPGAEVLVNGKRVGATPLPASVAVPPGKVNVELQRAGYRTSAQTIALDEGARGELSFTLEEDPAAPASVRGRLVVTASEPGAELTIDGGARRPLAGPVFLPVGPHRVRVDKAGYEYAERSVEVVNGQDASLQVTLAPTNETQAQLDASRSTRKIVSWSFLVGGAAIAAAGVVTALVENGSLSTAQSSLATYKATMENPGGYCDPALDAATYTGRGCVDQHAYYQDPVDKAKTLRLVGIAVGAAGVLSAAVGGYLLATTGPVAPASSSGSAAGGAASAGGVTGVAAWSSSEGGGLVLMGRF
jgi:hypothetical protein